MYLVLLDNYENTYGLFTSYEEAKKYADENIKKNPHMYKFDESSLRINF